MPTRKKLPIGTDNHKNVKPNLKIMMRSAKLNIVGILVLMLGFTAFSQTQAQVTNWKFDIADNTGMMVQVTTSGSNDAISKVELGKKGDAAWTQTEIQEMNYEETYIRVKSKGSGRVYELAVDWQAGKLVLTRPEGTSVTYWLRK
jgi:hypothetical protein